MSITSTAQRPKKVGARLSIRQCLALLTISFAIVASTSTFGQASANGGQEPDLSTLSDPLFREPYVDVDEWREKPVRHHYIHGGFKGTDARFSFYFPSKEQYKGRFFQHITPVPLSENSAQDLTDGNRKIDFAVASGAYFVESNEGGITPGGFAIAGYRANAAVAQYSRVLADQMYGPGHIYGYAFGGSGGAYKTISGFENTSGVWDGAVPFVIGSPMALPNVFTVRINALRILKDKFPGIVDAMDAGGSGDMYAGLNEEEKDALLEATRLGFPPRTWFLHDSLGLGALSVLLDGVVLADGKYFDDFWKKSGYLGANPTPSLTRARVQQTTAITKVLMPEDAAKLKLPAPQAEAGAPVHTGVDEAWKSLQEGAAARVPVGFELKDAPPGGLENARIVISSGASAGKSLTLRAVVGNVVMVGAAIGDQSATLNGIRPGDDVVVDNSIYLAMQTYHRHQVPKQGYPVFDQFRKTDGTPIYPQRPLIIGPLFSNAGAGSVQSGKFPGKMIVVESLMDEAAFPWQADWYKSQVQKNVGTDLDDHFRLWFTDHAIHTDAATPEQMTRIVSYGGILDQALRDLSAWVERGVPPPPSTSYRVVDGQVQVPASAIDRKGVQPTISLRANGKSKADVKVGQRVRFSAIVEAPPATGKIVSAQWDFDGSGAFAVPGKLRVSDSKSGSTTITQTYEFPKTGTYFVTLRAASQRDGDAATPYAQIFNLERVRVVVK